MATINFPSSPTLNQTYTYGNQTWYWNATGWALYPTSLTNVRPITKIIGASSTPIFDFTGCDLARITLNQNVTSSTFSGGVDGKKYILEVIQDATGNRTVVWPSNIRYGTDITAITLTTAASKKDRIGIIYDAASNNYDVVAIVKGF